MTMNRSHLLKPLRVVSLLLPGLLAVGAAGVAGQEAVEDYLFLVGSWQGQLEYLDYGDDRTRVTLPTALEAAPAEDGSAILLKFSFEEPGGGMVTSEERLAPTSGGVFMGAVWRVEEWSMEAEDEVYRVVLTREGEDNGRSASIRNSVVVERGELTMTTWVTYEDSPEPLQRNQYRLLRSR